MSAVTVTNLSILCIIEDLPFISSYHLPLENMQYREQLLSEATHCICIQVIESSENGLAGKGASRSSSSNKIPPCHGQGCHALEKVAQGPARPSWDLNLSYFKTIPSCPITINPRKKSLIFLEGMGRLLCPSLLQADQPQFPQPLLTGEVIHH